MVEPTCFPFSLKVTISLTFQCFLCKAVENDNAKCQLMKAYLVSLLFLILGLTDYLILLLKKRTILKSFRQIVCLYIKCF